MNEANYASLEASKRLAEAGILLETEAVWRLSGANETYFLQTGGSSPSLLIRWGDFPTPCMAEVWRELPDDCSLTKVKEDMFRATIPNNYEGNYVFTGSNPTDVLIDLLIWVRKEADHANT